MIKVTFSSLKIFTQLLCLLVFILFFTSCNKPISDKKIELSIWKTTKDTIVENNNPLLPYQNSKSLEVNYGLWTEALFLKIKLPEKKLENYFLKIGNPLTDSITVYIKENNIFKELQTGMLIPGVKKPQLHILPLIPLNNNYSNTIYAKIKSRVSLDISVSLLSKKQTENSFINISLNAGIIFGALIVFIIGAISIYIKQKNNVYLNYIGAGIFTLFTHLFLIGFPQYYFFSNSIHVSYYLFYISMFFAAFYILLFTRDLLETKENYVKGYKILQFLSISFLLLNFALFFLPTFWLSTITMIVMSIYFFAIIFIGVKISLQRNKIALTFALGWFIYIFGGLLNFLRVLELVPTNFFTQNISSVTLIAEFFVFLITLVFFYKKRKQQEEELILNISQKIKTELNEPNKNKYINLLSKTEIKIIEMIGLGFTSKEIADKLFVTEKTIRNHRYNISKKLELTPEKNNLLKWALQNTV
ncbi:7TMR-DISM extracellular protein 2 [Lutibacter sp. Hel_I_33_5]|uniref:7TM diverse intracellular signaling domain-containing protein n=1 Tax=Lutibacter sp. Hel_I_33_5 TaxID=1566289 RepID=UPI00119F40B9|nr:7TM diverse intracellular signaling domain-containing protein [Lutibacter sp. Hel_I_33_5]TVZ56761.1 7TMR-DISM extracellular protein 2 [Lutibacter sp. Hel_I_33_5]